MITIETNAGIVQRIARVERSRDRVRTIYVCTKCSNEYAMGARPPYSSTCPKCRPPTEVL